jgi:hypothetical protein
MKTYRHPGKDIAWHALVVVALVVVAWHLPLLWSSSSKKPRAPSSSRHSSLDTFVVFQPAPADVAFDPLLWQDPTVYLLPSPVGFTRALSEMRAQPRLSVESSPPPCVLDPSRIEFSTSLLDGSRPQINTLYSLMEPRDSASESRPAAEPWPSVVSAWRVTGPIAQRLIPSTSALPSVRSEEPLDPTILRIGVNRQGDPQYILIERSSGSDKADEAGAAFARTLAFSSSDGKAENPVVWGLLKIFWQPESPARKT